jgi:hypothetical protein
VNDRDVDLEPDDLVARLKPKIDEATDVVALVGYVGEGADGHCRLYADPELRASVDIPVKAIVHRHRIPAEQDTTGGRSVIWVQREAMRAPLVQESEDRLQSSFLSGPVASAAQLPQTLGDLAEELNLVSMINCVVMRHSPFCGD